MRRRRPRHAVDTPEELCSFVASEWPGLPWEAFRCWKNARHVFGKEHPESLLGDIIDQIRAERKAREEMAAWAGPDPKYAGGGTS